MSRSQYFDQMKSLAREIRTRYGLESPRVLKSDLRRIYKDQGIKIDLWPHKLRTLRGAYFNDEFGATVMLAKDLPDDPMIFTMGHELKHHLVDSAAPLAFCDKTNESKEIEIGAEIFAAELIYPEHDFITDMQKMGVKMAACKPEILVRLKHATKTTLSYAGLSKRAEFLGFAAPNSLQSYNAWKKLEESIFGVPLYKQLLARKRAQSTAS